MNDICFCKHPIELKAKKIIEHWQQTWLFGVIGCLRAYSVEAWKENRIKNPKCNCCSSLYYYAKNVDGRTPMRLIRLCQFHHCRFNEAIVTINCYKRPRPHLLKLSSLATTNSRSAAVVTGSTAAIINKQQQLHHFLQQHRYTITTMADAAKTFVDGKLKSRKVVVFSKTYCPFCTKAKVSIIIYH